MTDTYMAQKEEAAFEAAFAKLSPKAELPVARTGPEVRTVTNWLENDGNEWDSELPQ